MYSEIQICLGEYTLQICTKVKKNIIILFTGLFRLSRRLVLLHLLHPLALQGRGGDGVGGDLLVVLALHAGAGEHAQVHGGDCIVECLL